MVSPIPIVIRTLLSTVKVIAHPIDAAGGRRALALLQLAGLDTTRMHWKRGEKAYFV